MKIPTILAQTEVPASLPSGGGDTRSVQMGFHQLASNLTNVSNQANAVAAQIQKADQAKYDQGVKIEAATLQSQMELGAETALQTRRLTETDPDAYLKGAQQDIQDAAKAAMEQAKYPETKAYLQQHLEKIKATKGVEAMKYGNELYVSRNLGLLDTTLENTRQLAVSAPDQSSYVPGEDAGTYSKVLNRSDYYRQGLEAIRAATPLLGEKKATEKMLGWRQDVAYDSAESDLRANPESNITGYRGVVTPAQYDRLLAHQDTFRRELRVADEHREAQTQKSVDLENQNRVGEVEALLLPTDGSAPDRTSAMRMIGFYGPKGINVIKPTDYVRLYGMATNPKEGPSDPGVRNQMLVGVISQRPTWSVGDVVAANQAGKLNDNDMKFGLEQLRASQNRAEDKALTAVKYKQAEVEQAGIRFLTTTGPLEKIEDKARELQARYRLEMLNRSSAYGGKEDPHTIMNEVLPGLGKQLKNDMTDAILAKQKEIETYQYKTRQDLDAARQGNRISQKQYEAQARSWEQLRTMVESVRKLNADMAEMFAPKPK